MDTASGDMHRDDIEALIQDKYAGDRSVDLTEDLARIASGEPLAYVIGWIPFLGTTIDLASHPLIPRVETEWWTEQLISHLKERFGEMPFTLLDLCAGSGAIGIAVMKHMPNAVVTFAELKAEHAVGIEKSALQSGAGMPDVLLGNLFEPVEGQSFDIIATNPPYVPDARPLPESVVGYEPKEALYAGVDGLTLIRRIAREARAYVKSGGEIWAECDTTHIDEAHLLFLQGGASTATINEDQYGRPRFVVSYYS